VKNYLDLIDTTTTGGRYDVTPLFGNYHAFSALLDDLLELCREIEYDTVVGIDALGFILGSAIAVRAGKSFVPIRKGGKLPVEVHKASFIDYTGKEVALHLTVVMSTTAVQGLESPWSVCRASLAESNVAMALGMRAALRRSSDDR
jgi:hypothetical protein